MARLRATYSGRHYADFTNSDTADALVELAVAIVSYSGVAGLFEWWEMLDRWTAGKHRGGRRPTVSYLTVISLHLCLALMRRPQFHTKAADHVSNSFTEEQLKVLGLRIHEIRHGLEASIETEK